MCPKKSKISYRFLITAKSESPKKYRKFLRKEESISGLQTAHIIEIKNVGKNLFPGGSIDLKLEKPVGMGSLSASVLDEELETIKPKDSTSLRTIHTAEYQGVWVLSIEIKPKQKGDVEYFIPEEEEYSKEWSHAFIVVDRHQLDIKIMLEKILKKMG